jgi:hypothetical protein
METFHNRGCANFVSDCVIRITSPNRRAGHETSRVFLLKSAVADVPNPENWFEP